MEIIEEQIIRSEILIHDEKKFPRKPSLIPIPEDKFKIGYVFFFFMGVCHFMPMIFFATANNFWMYKFRNPQFEVSDPTNRTSLQKYFASSSQIANTAPTLIFGIFNIVVAYKYAITSRISITLGIQTLTFLLFTVSCQIDTDDFQGLFFGTVMLGYVFLSSTMCVNLVGSMSLYSRFPFEYTICCLIGEGVSAIAGDLIIILCIAAFDGAIINSTFVYFMFGSALLLTTFLLSVFASRTEFFQHCLHSIPQETKKMPSKKELLDVFGKIRNVIIIMSCFAIGMSVTHTAITALVVSEQSNTVWANSYFSPVMTFFLSDFSLLLGRLISSFIPIKISEKVFLGLTIIRTVVLVPLIWLCNAQPRKNLPVIFGHDYQYGLIFFILSVTNGYIMNYCSLYIPQKVDKKDADTAYTLFGLMMNLITTITSPIGMFIVNVL
ncbi:unnamed protein product [Ceutorhynchus assimilis]|uniref:Equilibrative nucleoside transporter 3 n=1 Tax=Ceutorhynchus assimilis TaxID=467358 RepID=A0A9N9ME11_9CUCU|nr:unnamed protein product [Ceutorhynchus assimilis]